MDLCESSLAALTAQGRMSDLQRTLFREINQLRSKYSDLHKSEETTYDTALEFFFYLPDGSNITYNIHFKYRIDSVQHQELSQQVFQCPCRLFVLTLSSRVCISPAWGQVSL